MKYVRSRLCRLFLRVVACKSRSSLSVARLRNQPASIFSHKDLYCREDPRLAVTSEMFALSRHNVVDYIVVVVQILALQ